MAEPAAKKARVEAAPDGEPAGAPAAEALGAPAEAVEREEDDKAQKGAAISHAVVFHPRDTTINVMESTVGGVLMPLTHGGLQYLLAGARASVGVKAGRYAFEVKIIESMCPADDPVARQKVPMPRTQLRVGFSTAGSSLFLGETEDSVCFDTEGALTHCRAKTQCAGKFGGDSVVAVLLNMDAGRPNANTISLFKDGVRISQPQPLPEKLLGKALYPTVTFKNCAVQVSFGPTLLAPLPFNCSSVQQAAAKDVVVSPAPKAPKSGQHEILFPVCLPDEGTFDWLDMFLESNPDYVELSDRAIAVWAERSGIVRQKTLSPASSNDKPDMAFGIPALGDGGILRVLQSVAQVQERNFVVMQVKANLVKQERAELLSKWSLPGFKKVALVLMATPKADFKSWSQTLALKDKQEASDAEFQAKKEEDKKRRETELRKKQLEKEKAKALKKQAAAAAALKRKMEVEKRKKEAAAKGEEYNEEEDEEMKALAAEAEQAEKEAEEPEEAEAEADEPMDEEPPKVELTADEKKVAFRKKAISDLTPYVLSTTFTKFSVPESDEGFDEIRHEWAPAAKCKEYLKHWVSDRKNTTRIEQLQPGEWFIGKYKEWQRGLQTWRTKQSGYKTLVTKRAQERAAKQAKRAAEAAAREARLKAAAAKREAAAKAAAESGEAEKEKPAEEPPAEEKEEKEEKEEEDEPEPDPNEFSVDDVFGVEDILDVGKGEPLFAQFSMEDWTMMSLRFEMHLLAHAFRRDANDPDRVGIHVEHLAFYYQRYFKKTLNHKLFGVETVQEMLDMVKDTVVTSGRGKVVESLLPDDMESNGIFAMLTEEARRDRERRVDCGDDSARLKLVQTQISPGGLALAGVRPASVMGAAPGAAMGAGIRPGGPMGAARPVAPVRPQGWPLSGLRPTGMGMGGMGMGGMGGMGMGGMGMGGAGGAGGMGGMGGMGGKGGMGMGGSPQAGWRPQAGWF